MDAMDKLTMMAELNQDHCSLYHGPGVDNAEIPAADYIVMSFGYEETAGQDIAVRELVIPVCFDCALALKGEEWTLLYCFECSESRWVCRRLAKNRYRHHILWLRGCPECSNTFGGVYFTDIRVYGSTAHLGVNEVRIAV